MLVFVIRRNYQVRLFTNGRLWGAVFFSLLMQAIIMYTPLNTIFKVTPLAWPELLRLFGATAIFSLICLLFGAAPQERRTGLPSAVTDSGPK
jgi:Ca2+-transporting ATPase